MEDLPEALVTEIIKKITRTSDLNSLSLVSKQLYMTEGNQRGAIRVGSGLCTATEALTSLCARFPNLRKVEIDYSGWIPGHGNQLDSKGLFEFSSHCSSLIDLTLSFCSYIDDSGLGCLAYCKTLVSLRLISAPQIMSIGLFSVAVGCLSLSALHLIDCEKIDTVEWLEYLGRNGSLEELVVKNCRRINHHDLLMFGSGWMKLQKFEFEKKRGRFDLLPCDEVFDSTYDAHITDIYDFCCESLKDLRLAHIKTWPEIGLRVVLGKCKALENLSLEYVLALNDNDIVALSRTCSNLKSISLGLNLQHYSSDISYWETRTSFTDNSLYALALNCRMLQIVDLKFTGCADDWPFEIGFTQKGFLVLIQSCPIRVLVLNTAYFLDDEGMKALSSSPHLETLELIFCPAVTDAGMCFIAHTPCLSNLTLRSCHEVTDVGMAELGRARKLESLVIEHCGEVSLKGVQGVAKSVHYSENCSAALSKKICLGGGF
ncbi:F-box/LRR-repeat protein 14-like [Lolium rigidum]|uniref:F-box/LRR-repeat protein 14-like n=1 Tax=Lolium rigidum TaxID=89674 RepID=UPI001F5C881B|nr:F-box/LRR-repeat protein 14-like [Lolium rigidum]XP_047049651.1 F-box/LRR-repeat protein 14-like [Lolium rigidum]XP_047049652.1 F-box/LRR-repeat protein 14-like [Lolium rigidum]